MIYKDLVSKEKKMAIIGLGYVGLPIALEFARKISVIGFDIKPDRVEMMKNKVNHKQYAEMDEAYFESIIHDGAVFADLKGIFRDQINKLQYWSL